jgi:predicted metal-binding membrane protein
MREMQTMLKHDRRRLGIALILVTAVAWAYMAWEAIAMYRTGTCSCAGMRMSGDDVSPWSTATLLPLFLMWTEMMVAMMLPTAAPMILAFATLTRREDVTRAPFKHTSVFALGYLAIWTAFSMVATLAQWLLNATGLLTPMMESNSSVLAGTLLVIAGLFQFAPFKNNCLSQCRSPERVLKSGWLEGLKGAWRMGLRHGTHCAGCCWVLMALLFVGGVMNLWWIAIISAFVFLEKVLPRVRQMTRLSGAALGLWGMWVLLS